MRRLPLSGLRFKASRHQKSLPPRTTFNKDRCGGELLLQGGHSLVLFRSPFALSADGFGERLRKCATPWDKRPIVVDETKEALTGFDIFGNGQLLNSSNLVL